ncbi:hypothetical protein [Bacillus marinisedimentorum]|uniref:hypothetical protein n=1 Tax=Bacillus marinisedimentorum TaxID=1821260 RepID=UPI0008726198|nr:hypothetical protein [Bacillus marinisedimentorum]
MNNEKLKKRVKAATNELLYEKGYASAVDMFMEIGKLSQKDYEAWRKGQVPYLERVIGMNLSKISFAAKEFRKECREQGAKPSFTVYKGWGMKRKKLVLRFSKSGNEQIEKSYATHYVHKRNGK